MTGMIIEIPDGDESEETIDRIDVLIEKLDKVTDQYSCGQDDGKMFFASENDEVLRMLKEEFPDVKFQKLKMEDWPWDQCHI